MNKITHIKSLIFLIISSLILSSCGDLFSTAKKDEEVSLQQFSSCELDSDAFGFIFEKNIKGDIECLRDKLKLFVETVETDKPGYISKDVLKDFVVNGPMDFDQDILYIVDAFFDLGHMLFGGERERMAKGNVNIMLDILVVVNNHAWKIYRLYQSEDPVNYGRHVDERSIVESEFAEIVKKVKEVLNNSNNPSLTINLESLIFSFFHDKPDTLNKVRSMMFLKRVFLGGETYSLRFEEFQNLLEIAPEIISVAFDIVKIDYYEFDDEQRILLNVLLNDIEVIKEKVFFEEDSHQAVFTIYDVINMVDTLAPDLLPIDITKYPKELMLLKEMFLGEGGEFVSSIELFRLFKHLHLVLIEGDFFYKVYEHYKEEIESGKRIAIDFSDYPVYNSEEEFFLHNFSRILSNYRFVKGSFEIPFYTYEYNRNPNAYFEIVALEYVTQHVMAYYGRANENARGGYDITLDQTVNLVRDFKWLLKDEGILSIGRKGGGEIQGIADNFVLLSTLFQNQSDGCDTETVCMEVPEAVEFITGMLTAIQVKDSFSDKMMEMCADSLDEYDRISPSCFRNKFLSVLESEIPEDGRTFADYLPQLYKYFKELIKDLPPGADYTDSDGYRKFLFETESFTRKCLFYDEDKKEEVYLTRNDAFAVFAGLLNVESTVMRFDFNENNIIDGWVTTIDGKKYPNELMTAYYNVYKGAVVALVSDKVGGIESIGKKLAKPVFQYLIKYGKVPDVSGFKTVWDFVKFLVKKNKKANATRTTIANVLKVIGDSSDTALTNPYKCEECFRNPNTTCEPEGEAWDY